MKNKNYCKPTKYLFSKVETCNQFHKRMKKISLFTGSSRRPSRSGDRLGSKLEVGRTSSGPESNETLRKLVNVKHEVTGSI